MIGGDKKNVKNVYEILTQVKKDSVFVFPGVGVEN